MNDHHRPCACGAELEDECPRCARTNPLGSMRITRPEPCPGCPFAACLGCQWQGGEPVAAQAISTDSRYDVSTNEAAPGGASTPESRGLADWIGVD